MASIATKIYNKMPVVAQNGMISLYGWRWRKRRFGGIFSDQRCRFKAREGFSAEELRERKEDYRNIFGRADYLQAPSHFLSDAISKELNLKVSYLPNPINFEYFRISLNSNRNNL